MPSYSGPTLPTPQKTPLNQGCKSLISLLHTLVVKVSVGSISQMLGYVSIILRLLFGEGLGLLYVPTTLGYF